MDILREKISCAAMELKVAIFCAVLMGLSYVYKIIEPLLGVIIFKLSIITFCASLMVFAYKVVFGSIGVTASTVLVSLYVSAAGSVLEEPLIFRVGLGVALLCIAVKAFIWIFVHGRNDSEQELHEQETIEQSDEIPK